MHVINMQIAVRYVHNVYKTKRLNQSYDPTGPFIAVRLSK